MENVEGMFEKASRTKLRICTKMGVISIEDLWTLSLPALDDIAKSLNKEVKALEEESFIAEVTSSGNEPVELGFAIVKHVIKYKLERKKEQKSIEANKAKKAEIAEIIHRKQAAALEEKTEEELLKLLDDL